MSVKPLAMRDALLERIWGEMGRNSDVFLVSADFGSPVLDKIRADYADQFVNVGIAEQNLINISAGLALEGRTVFAYSIAPFITMRCYEQTRVSLALLSNVREMNVNLIGVGAGFSYVVSGPTHQCYEDISLMRAMPNFRILSPADHLTSAALLDVCLSHSGPKYLRLDAQVLPVVHNSAGYQSSRGFVTLRSGSALCLVATGFMVHTALEVADRLESEGKSVGVIDLIDLTHFDHSAFLKIIENYATIASFEEGFKGRGGMDAMLLDLLNREKPDTSFINFGVEGGYRFELGSRQELHESVSIGPETIYQKLRPILG